MLDFDTKEAIREDRDWSQDELEEILERSFISLQYFCETFLPNLFWKPFSKIHMAIFEILDDNSIQKYAIAAPRGVGKTSIVNRAYPLKRILFEESKYIIPISATADKAVEYADNVRHDMVGNPNIVAVPDWSHLKSEDRSDPFGRTEWVTSTGIKVLPRGAGQQIRGGLYGDSRPDLYNGDDIEEDEAVLSEDRRGKLADWWFSAVENSVDLGSDRWRVGMVGTILHEDSLLRNMLKDQSYTTVKLQLCDEQFVSNWPDHLSTEKVRALADDFRARGMIDVFAREFMNEPIAKEGQSFKDEYFKDYRDKYTDEDLTASREVETMILMDPAKTHTTGSADTAIAAVSVNTKSNEIYVRDIVKGQMFPNELIDNTLKMADQFRAIVIAPEVTGLNEYLTYPLQNEVSRRGLFYVMIEVKPREGKTGPRRSGGLVPLYRQGLVWHNRDACRSLEIRLLQWPRPEKWDEIDAVSGLIFVLEEGARYFTSLDSPDDPKAIEAEYAELDNDEPLMQRDLISMGI